MPKSECDYGREWVSECQWLLHLITVFELSLVWVVECSFPLNTMFENWDFYFMPCLPLPLIFLPTPKVIHFLFFLSSAIIVINQSQVTVHTKTKKSRKVKWRVSALPYYYYHCVLSFLPSRASYKLSYTVQLITWLSRIWKAKLLLGFLKIDIF